MLPESDRTALRQDQDRLRRMLERTVGRAVESGAIGRPEHSEVSILDVACGACDEAETLSEFFSRLRSKDGRDPTATRLLGADVRERELGEARERFRSAPSRSFEFTRVDASRLTAHRTMGDAFDVLVFRHQNLYHGRTLWHRIFDEALHKLSDDGMIVITSYFDREHSLALEAFQSLGAEVVLTERNPYSRPLPTRGKSVDRHVAVLRKQARRISAGL